MSRTKKGRKVYTVFNEPGAIIVDSEHYILNEDGERCGQLIPDGVDDLVQFPSHEDYQALNDGKTRVLITNKDYVGFYCVETGEELLKVFEAEKIRIERNKQISK